jgi:hypothetical protein
LHPAAEVLFRTVLRRHGIDALDFHDQLLLLRVARVNATMPRLPDRRNRLLFRGKRPFRAHRRLGRSNHPIKAACPA